MTRTTRLLVLAALLPGLLPAACGPKNVGGTNVPPRQAFTPSRWTYVSEVNPVKQIVISGDSMIAFTGGALVVAPKIGGKIQTRKLELPETIAASLDKLAFLGEKDIWIAGPANLYHVEGDTVSPATDVSAALGAVTLLAAGPDGWVWAGGQDTLAFFDRTAWRAWDMPFSVGGGVMTPSGTLWVMAGEKGVASVSKGTVAEYPNPRLLASAAKPGDFVPLSVASAGERAWVLWTGANSYLSVLQGGEWNSFTLPAALAGETPRRLFAAGKDVYLLTSGGLYRIADGISPETIPLAPLGDCAPAVALTYTLTARELAAKGGFFEVKKEFLLKPAPRPPLPAPPADEAKDFTPYSLEPCPVKTSSPVTALERWGDLLFVGTERLGISVYRKDGLVENELYLYDAKPRVPVSLFSSSEKEVFYPLAGGRMGAYRDGGFRSFALSDSKKESVLGVDRDESGAYAITLLAQEETVQVYKYVGGAFGKIQSRKVDIATGIGSIGGFAVAPDGTFWFSIKSYGEGQEMGAAELRPDVPELVYNAALAQGQAAVKIPNGVSSIKVTKEGVVWLGGMEGVVRIDKARGVKRYREPDGLIGDYVTDMALDKNGRLWLVTVEGLGWMDGGKLSFPSGSAAGGTGVTCVGIGNDGNALIVDEEGLKRHDGSGWVLVGKRANIVGSPVLDVQGDGVGHIWVVTDRAISIYSEQ